MPMFPLTQPLVPGALLPLRIFEPRYVQMFQAILADDDHPPEFGVTMIERGFEVGGGEQRTDVGCVARIVDMSAGGGQYSVVAVGTERLRVVAWLPDDPYPQADVERWPDDDADELPAGEVERLLERMARINEMAGEAGSVTPPADQEISDDPRLALYHIGALSPIGPADRHRLLCATSLRERAAALATALDDVEAVLEFRRS